MAETSGGGQAACALANFRMAHSTNFLLTMAYMFDMIYHDNHGFFLGGITWYNGMLSRLCCIYNIFFVEWSPFWKNVQFCMWFDLFR